MVTCDEPETTFCELMKANVSASTYEVTPDNCDPSPTKDPEKEPDRMAAESLWAK